MDEREWKARVLYRQHLTGRAGTVAVCRELNGIQAQFSTAAFHALRIRSEEAVRDNDGRLVKSWTLRGTMHLFAADEPPLYLYKDRQRLLRPVDQMAEDDYITLERKQYFADSLLNALDRGIVQRDEPRAHCLSHGMTEREGESVFNAWGGLIRCLAEKGELCYRAYVEKTFIAAPPLFPWRRRRRSLKWHGAFSALRPRDREGRGILFQRASAMGKGMAEEASRTGCGGRWQNMLVP